MVHQMFALFTKTWLSLGLIALISQANAQTVNLNQRVESTSLRATGLMQVVGERDGKKIIQRLDQRNDEIPSGTRFTFVPANVLVHPIVRNGEGRESVSAGRYFGSVTIDTSSVPRSQRRRLQEMNNREIYVYEWHINKDTYLRTVFDLEPRDKTYLRSTREKFEWDRISTKGLWTSEAARILQGSGRDLLENPPADVEEFCPNYQRLDFNGRTAFWIHLLNSIARRESAFDPMVGNDESHFGDNNHGVVSRGLLQISSQSIGRPYRDAGCNISRPSDLHDVTKNLECGVAIFKHWADRDECISCRTEDGAWRGIARYWSTLRERYQVSCRICSSGFTNVGYKDQIIQETANTSICRAR
jgi:hypothetical protein